MSTKYNLSDEIPSEVICARLEELSKAVSEGREAVAREFTMRVPAECDRDADLVLATAAKRIRALESAATSPAAVGDVHPDDTAVDRFAAAMKGKLAKKRSEGRGGWQNKDECSAEFLSQLLRRHVDKSDPVDVANFCMMLHQRGECIQPPHDSPILEARSK